jgi:hypothetical protein
MHAQFESRGGLHIAVTIRPECSEPRRPHFRAVFDDRLGSTGLAHLRINSTPPALTVRATKKDDFRKRVCKIYLATIPFARALQISPELHR